MESRIGLDYIVENPEYTAKLATGIITILFVFRVYNNIDILCHYADSIFMNKWYKR